MAMQQHYVIFYSPGTFVAEESSKPVDAWDVDAAVEAARKIRERHNAVPYGFCFITRARGDDDLDAKEVARSPFYYLGGKIETLAEIEARADPKEWILLGNMRSNGYDRVIVNTNSRKWTQPLDETGVVLDFEMHQEATS